MTNKIYLAFRFHGNFYHSYRGDTPDELGFGKDIRIIRHLINTLDKLNRRGIPVRGTWDFENLFSLEQIMPTYCPDIITSLQRRVREEQDEMQLMSYNNGLINAHTAQEFEATIQRGITNSKGSGLGDLFQECPVTMVRPQEMMYTPIHLRLYTACGIHAISLFYSALPFNGFSNFIPPLAFEERYNPLMLTYPGIAESMTLLPCYNTGDLADHLTLRRWVKKMRRKQLQLENPQDLLLLIDMDADDDFWVGFDIPLLRGRFSTIGGLKGLVEDVVDLDYVHFTTPGRYIESHKPISSISINQDTADGSFDGLSSWTEKWCNHRLWTGLERARILDLQTRRLLEGQTPEQVYSLLEESFETRLKILSTTHFGMAAPVMNLSRERVAHNLVSQAVETACQAFERTSPKPEQSAFSLLDYVRGVSTGTVEYAAKPSRALVRLALRESAPEIFALQDESGKLIASAVIGNAKERELLFVQSFRPAEHKRYTILNNQSPPSAQSGVKITESLMKNECLQLEFDHHGQLNRVLFDGSEVARNPFLRSGLTYAGKQYQVSRWEEETSLSLGIVGLKTMLGSLMLKGGYPVRYERQILLADGMPYIYITTRVFYPRTPNQGYDPNHAERLQQVWDNSWQEVMPCEIQPALTGKPERPLRVWKHNFCDHVSTFSLDYARYSKNKELDSVNNQITHAWVAVTDGERGFLVAQSADFNSNPAFCPLRTRREDSTSRLLLNPFGTYWGRQYRYATADTGLGNLLAVRTSASGHIKPYAPSYNGQVQEFRLLVAPYHGNMPPETIRNDAEAFAYPYLVLNDDLVIAPPAHRSWEGVGLG